VSTLDMAAIIYIAMHDHATDSTPSPACSLNDE
jgi:hypothetical protein